MSQSRGRLAFAGIMIAGLAAVVVAVTVSGRRVTLPEHPLLWAAFFLSGEP